MVERQNLNKRISMRRITRLINRFSKKAENNEQVTYICFIYYNLHRAHKTLMFSLAKETGISDQARSI
jgi:tryptophan synthase alpha subunit